MPVEVRPSSSSPRASRARAYELRVPIGSRERGCVPGRLAAVAALPTNVALHCWLVGGGSTYWRYHAGMPGVAASGGVTPTGWSKRGTQAEDRRAAGRRVHGKSEPWQNVVHLGNPQLPPIYT